MREIFCDWEGVCEGLGDTLASIPGLSIADAVAYCHHRSKDNRTFVHMVFKARERKESFFLKQQSNG
jgi:hypothetical protein